MVEMLQVNDVVKEFTIRNVQTLKERLVWRATGRSHQLSHQFRAVDHVTFSLERGESLGLIGHNGSGKSTMLKLISGVMQPSEGTIRYRGKMAGLIEVGAGFHPDLTGRENVYLNGAILGMTKAEIEESFDDIVGFSDIDEFIDTEVKFYSSGMFLRLAFSVAVHTDPDVFLVDEILAVGDEAFQKKCITRIKKMQESGCTLIIVSHDLEMVKKMCSRGILLEHGKIQVDGTPDEAVEALRAAH